MSNKKQFRDNLNARVRIRPLVHYADLGKFLDEEWTINEIQDKWIKVSNPNGYFVIIGHDARRGGKMIFQGRMDTGAEPYCSKPKSFYKMGIVASSH